MSKQLAKLFETVFPDGLSQESIVALLELADHDELDVMWQFTEDGEHVFQESIIDACFVHRLIELAICSTAKMGSFSSDQVLELLRQRNETEIPSNFLDGLL